MLDSLKLWIWPFGGATKLQQRVVSSFGWASQLRKWIITPFRRTAYLLHYYLMQRMPKHGALKNLNYIHDAYQHIPEKANAMEEYLLG